mmetsp:Transcript_4554/g.12872  ORF Transcript_4554/g.12872 Transcript_4554/m.12872 type:complete len:246 (+) Transcript_4554:73-810(+)
MRLTLPQAACLPVVAALCLVGIASAFNFQICTNNVCRKQPLQQLHASSTSDDAEDEARKLRELASQLRGEVDAFQQEKDEVAAAEEKERDEIIAAKQETRMRYSAEVPILKGDGQTAMERVDFPPRIKDGKSSIMAVQANLPLGILLGEHEEIPGAISVDEVAAESNGERADVREGDILRACTACQQTMETPTWQLLAGGIGQPKTKRFMFATDGRPFEEVMDAVGSNRMDPEGRAVWLVLERPE